MLTLFQIEQEGFINEILAKYLHLIAIGEVKLHSVNFCEGYLAVNSQSAVTKHTAVNILLTFNGNLVITGFGYFHFPGNPITDSLPAVAADGVQPNLGGMVWFGSRVTLIENREKGGAGAINGVLTLNFQEDIPYAISSIAGIILRHLGIGHGLIRLVEAQMSNDSRFCPSDQLNSVKT